MGGKERTDAVWRDVHRGRVWRAQACRIVEETPELLALWIPAGAPGKVPAGGVRIPGDEWELEDTAPSAEQLCLARRGRAHSIYVFWNEAAVVEKLDLIVRPDESYVWKDEDELEQAAVLGLLDAAAVRAEAVRVLEEWPFPGWEDWRPDPSWPIPRLPGGWDRV